MKQANVGTLRAGTGATTDFGRMWNSLNWDEIETEVKRLQIRIAEAVKNKKWNKMKVLQRILTRSFYARLLAVKRVTSSKGSTTPGIDNVVWNSARKKYSAAIELTPKGYKAKPLKRVAIPKKNGKKRPLGIPTMKDRAMQALYLLALEPVGETTADKNSYGFRPHRACRDATAQCFCALAKKNSPRWILDADIKACFDGIDHDWLIENIPIEKRILKQWLKCGYMEKKVLFPTKAGTPQGGIISPLLANMALDGMEVLLKKHTRRKDKVNFIRYADDFIVTAASKELLEKKVVPIVSLFLNERGLELSSEKTKIVNIEDGFEFLSQNMRKFRENKYLTQPSKESIKSHLKRVKKTISECRGQNAEFLIHRLNPVIRGWTNYHRYAQSGKAFYYCQYQVNGYLLSWAKRKHRNKTPKWMRNHYWGISQDKRHFSCFTTENGKSKLLSLNYYSEYGLARYIKIRGGVNPYDKNDLAYFKKRARSQISMKVESRRILPLIYS